MRINGAVERGATVESTVCCEELSAVEGLRSVDGGCWTLELADAAAGERLYAFFMLVGDERVELAVDWRAADEPCLRPIDYPRPGSAR